MEWGGLLSKIHLVSAEIQTARTSPEPSQFMWCGYRFVVCTCMVYPFLSYHWILLCSLCIVLMSFNKVEATLNILKYNSLGYPGTENGVAATNFHQFSIQNKIRPADPSVFPFEAFRSPANSGHGDFRRVQDICDTQRTALDRCFPDEQCAQCYGDAIDVAVNKSTTCGAEETRLCAISNTTCFARVVKWKRKFNTSAFWKTTPAPLLGTALTRHATSIHLPRMSVLPPAPRLAPIV